MLNLQYILRGIRLEELKDQPSQRLPVTINVLRKVHSVLLLDPNNCDDIMRWAAFLLCFFDFVTIPDQNPLVNVTFQDISADNPTEPSLLKV